MAIFPFVGDSPKEMTDGGVKVNGVWKQATVVFEKVGGEWKEAWRNILNITSIGSATIEKKLAKVTPTVRLINVQLTILYKNGNTEIKPMLSTIIVKSTATNIFYTGNDGIPYLTATANTVSAENKIVFSIYVRVGSEYAGISIDIGRIELVE